MHETLYDFNDFSKNLSQFPMAAQASMYAQLVTTLKQRESNTFNCLLYSLISAISLGALCSSASPSNLICVGSEMLEAVFITYTSHFNKDNVLIFPQVAGMLNKGRAKGAVIAAADSYAGYLSALRTDSVCMAALDLDKIGGERVAVYEQLARVLRPDGILAAFGSGCWRDELGEVKFEADKLVLRFDELGYLMRAQIKKDWEPTSDYRAAMELIGVFNSEIASLTKQVLRPAGDDESAWYDKLGALVRSISSCEDFLLSRLGSFHNPDIEYYLNEVKNAALDLESARIVKSRYFDEFSNSLFDCYNEWTQQAY